MMCTKLGENHYISIMAMDPHKKRHYRKDRGMGMQDSSVVLGHMLKKTGLGEKFKQAHELKLLNSWDEVVGSAVAEQVRLIDVKNGTLLLKTNSPVWKNEVNLQKKAIFKRSNEILGKVLIRNLRFV